MTKLEREPQFDCLLVRGIHNYQVHLLLIQRVLYTTEPQLQTQMVQNPSPPTLSDQDVEPS